MVVVPIFTVRLAEVVPVFRARSGLRMNELIVLELNRCLISNTLLGEGKVRNGKVSSKRASNPENFPNSDFSAWWEIYPRKVARKAAEKAFSKALGDIQQSERADTATAAELLLRWTKDRVQSLLSTDDKFRPHPATWLNDGRYRDAVTVSKFERPIERIAPETKRGDYVVKPKMRAT